MAKRDVLNLEEVFGGRERPKVRVKNGGQLYELRLPDEMDPVDQLSLEAKGRRIADLYAQLEQNEDDKTVLHDLAEALAHAFKQWIGLLNTELAEEKLGFAMMSRIIEFYQDYTGLSGAEGEGESQGGPGDPKATGETSSAN